MLPRASEGTEVDLTVARNVSGELLLPGLVDGILAGTGKRMAKRPVGSVEFQMWGVFRKSRARTSASGSGGPGRGAVTWCTEGRALGSPCCRRARCLEPVLHNHAHAHGSIRGAGLRALGNGSLLVAIKQVQAGQ